MKLQPCNSELSYKLVSISALPNFNNKSLQDQKIYEAVVNHKPQLKLCGRLASVSFIGGVSSNHGTWLQQFDRENSNWYISFNKGLTVTSYTRFVQKVSGLTTVHEVDKAYGVLTLIVFNIVPFRSYTLRPTLLPLFETFCKLLFRDV